MEHQQVVPHKLQAQLDALEMSLRWRFKANFTVAIGCQIDGLSAFKIVKANVYANLGHWLPMAPIQGKQFDWMQRSLMLGVRRRK